MRSVLTPLACLCFASVSAWAQPPDNPLAHDQQKFDQAAAEYDAGHYDVACRMFLDLAEDDDVAAMRNVALMKRKGIGCARDPQGALEYMKRAAEGGLPTAAADLGDMLLNGEAGRPDPEGAVRWLKLAAAARHPRAEFELAQMYEAGTIVPKDIVKAEILYEDAAAAGLKEAYARLNAIKAVPSEASPAQNDPATAPGGANVASTFTPATAAAMSQGKAFRAEEFVVQIGAYKSESDALDSWRAYRTAHPAMAEFEPDIQEANLPGKGRWYRLRIGAFSSIADANALCAKLKAGGGDCFTTKR